MNRKKQNSNGVTASSYYSVGRIECFQEASGQSFQLNAISDFSSNIKNVNIRKILNNNVKKPLIILNDDNENEDFE